MYMWFFTLLTEVRSAVIYSRNGCNTLSISKGVCIAGRISYSLQRIAVPQNEVYKLRSFRLEKVIQPVNWRSWKGLSGEQTQLHIGNDRLL